MHKREYEALKTEIEQATHKANKAEGALEQLMKELEADHDCKSIKKAEVKLKELKSANKKAQKSFDAALESFNEKWEDNGEEDDDSDDGDEEEEEEDEE